MQAVLPKTAHQCGIVLARGQKPASLLLYNARRATCAKILPKKQFILLGFQEERAAKIGAEEIAAGIILILQEHAADRIAFPGVPIVKAA
jgi:hypothetical protein